MNDVFVFGWLVDELLTTVPGNPQLTRGNCNCQGWEIVARHVLGIDQTN